MVPDIAKTGRSFKGAMAYYLHDKRQEADAAHPQTAERVAWTETRNLATDDPQAAQRIMIATAKQADELKAAAGIKNTGRKSNAHVYAYSLAWHPDEADALDRAEMARAVDSSLKALGAGAHQAVIVCHRDQKHPHVHVILNRVHPETGVMLSTSNDRLKLSDWANAYERERGLIVTPKREEKRQIREQFAEKAERRQYAEQKRAEAAKRPDDSKSRAAMLKEFGDQQKADHKKQWGDLAAKNKAGRDRIYSIHGERITEALARHKAETKPIWAQHFRMQREAERQFQQRENSLSGVIQNAIMATATQKISGQLGNRGTLSATFGNVLSSQARAQAFAAVQDMTRRELAGELKAIVDREIQGLKDERAKDLASQRQLYAAQREALISRQNDERAKIRAAWQHIYAERSAPDRRDDRGRKPYWKARQEAAPVQEQKPMKRTFDNARGIEQRTPSAAPTKTAFISQAQPAPSPSGDVPKPAPKAAQQVPIKTPALPKVAPATPAPRRDWTPAAKPAQPTPAPRRDWSAAAGPKVAPEIKKDWSAKAPDQTRSANKPLPPRDRSRDREPER